MVQIVKVDTANRRQVEAFVRFPYRHYRDCPQWVPPLLTDARLPLNRRKHPFYEHSEADFFLALQGGEVVGRVAALENKRFNRHHDLHDAEIYFFESVDDWETAQALFAAVFAWAQSRGLNRVVGPKGFSAFDGYGLLVEGFEHRQMMTMMNYNYPYYPRLFERAGFEKEVDFVSCYLPMTAMSLPERVERIAARVKERRNLQVRDFRSRRELRRWADKIGRAYNDAFVNNWEYYPLTEREIKFITDNLMLVADPRLLKIITHGEEVVGFLFAFPDVSAALQRARGRLNPWTLADLLLEMRRTKWVSGNGMGILPRYHGIGGNALLYAEMARALEGYGFEHLEMTQVAETAVQMRRDLVNLGGQEYKNHRVYRREL